MTPPIDPRDVLAPGTLEEEALLAELARMVIGRIARELPTERRRHMLEHLETELAGRLDPAVVRRDCPWCGRERTRRDDNHPPDCPVWEAVRAGFRTGLWTEFWEEED